MRRRVFALPSGGLAAPTSAQAARRASLRSGRTAGTPADRLRRAHSTGYPALGARVLPHHPEEQSMAAPPSARRDRLKPHFPKLVEMTNAYVYGDVWERKQLSKRDRSVVTIAALVGARLEGAVGEPHRARARQRAEPGRGRRDHHAPLHVLRLALGHDRLARRGGRVRGRGQAGRADGMKIGFIGLGTMGAFMAANLQKAQHRLVVNDVRKGCGGAHVERRRGMGGHAARGRGAVRRGVHLAARAAGGGGGGVRPGRAAGRRASGPRLFRPVHQLAGADAAGARGHGGAGRAGLRRAGLRRAGGGEDGQARHLGGRRPGHLRDAQAGAGRLRRPGGVYRPDRLRHRRQAGAQPGRLRDPDGHGGGLQHGREGGRGPAGAVEDRAPGRARPPPHLRPHRRPVPGGPLRPAGLRAEAGAQGRHARGRAGARGRRADAAVQPGDGGDERGDGPRRLGDAQLAHPDEDAAGARGRGDTLRPGGGAGGARRRRAGGAGAGEERADAGGSAPPRLRPPLRHARERGGTSTSSAATRTTRRCRWTTSSGRRCRRSGRS